MGQDLWYVCRHLPAGIDLQVHFGLKHLSAVLCRRTFRLLVQFEAPVQMVH